MFCKKCMLLVDAQKCPYCGNSNLYEPQPNDYCFITEKEFIWSELIADVLEQNGIPFYKKPKLGAGMAIRVGLAQECYRFYVPFSHIEKARTLVEQLFPCD